MIDKIKGFLQTTRFFISLFYSILIFLVSGSLTYSFLSFIFLLFSFIFNDIVDYRQDKLAHPDRALPRKRITLSESIFLAIYLAAAGLIISYSFHYFILFAIFYSASIIYSALLKKVIPSIALFFCVLIGTFLFLFPVKASVIEYLLVFFFSSAREFLLYYRDRITDNKFSLTKSLPNLLKNHYFIPMIIFLIIPLVLSLFMDNLILVLGASSALAIFLIFYIKGIHITKLKQLIVILTLHFIMVIFI